MPLLALRGPQASTKASVETAVRVLQGTGNVGAAFMPTAGEGVSLGSFDPVSHTGWVGVTVPCPV